MDRVDIGAAGFDGLIGREWLLANGLGGYASSTLCGLNTRKYHGLLVAALLPPVRRMVLLSHLEETVVTDTAAIELGCNEYPGAIYPDGYKHLVAFNPAPFPRWAYQASGFTLEKSVQLIPGQNTVCVSYTLLAGDKSVQLELRPQFALRPMHDLMYQFNGIPQPREENSQIHIPATSRTPEVFLAHNGNYESQPNWYLNTIYRHEQERGYAGLEDLWSPGIFRRALLPGQTMRFICSTDPIDIDRVETEIASTCDAPAGTAPGDMDDLLHAAGQFIVQKKSPDRSSTAIITHYPWSTPSLRGWMISLPGLLLVPGRFGEAKSLLESAASMMEDGVIPTELSEDAASPIFQGADVSLWFAYALQRYFACTSDDGTARALLPAVDAIIRNYSHGTRLGITMDADGLIASRVPAMATTWMDAKVGDWVITPRQGRPVELNALWYNALCFAADLFAHFGQNTRATELLSLAEKVRQSFNRRFWNAAEQCLFDVVDDRGADPAIRPNQIFSISLPHPVLDPLRWPAVINIVMNHLVTPFGLRTLSPRDPAYQGRYAGNIVNRDRAYHQGSAYPWLIGPLVTALIKSRGRTESTLQLARSLIEAPLARLRGEGLGLICELFDGDAPHHPGGAIACAPATGELLRCLAEDILSLPQTAGNLASGNLSAFPPRLSASA
ncbi:MAG TPA: amylo-alpha-1,6-glucosidase [Tepidisphaeraceae bacterium]|nr:amylo-alpha-1,6-glucosidase [Tepidisphaeraceae bacterium]